MPLTVKQKVERRIAVRKAAKDWEKRLVDVSGRNPLRNYHDRARSTLDLTPGNENEVNPRAIGSLLAGRAVRMTTLFPSEDAHRDVRRRLTAIHRTAQANSDEKGIDTLFAAAGLATWEVETGTKPNAPVILIPLEIIPTNAGRSEFTVRRRAIRRSIPCLRTFFKANTTSAFRKRAAILPKICPVLSTR